MVLVALEPHRGAHRVHDDRDGGADRDGERGKGGKGEAGRGAALVEPLRAEEHIRRQVEGSHQYRTHRPEREVGGLAAGTREEEGGQDDRCEYEPREQKVLLREFYPRHGLR